MWRWYVFFRSHQDLNTVVAVSIIRIVNLLVKFVPVALPYPGLVYCRTWLFPPLVTQIACLM